MQRWCALISTNRASYWHTYTCLAKFLGPILANFTSNEYTVKDKFSFADKIVNQVTSCYMASFDVNSLFTNIPLYET